MGQSFNAIYKILRGLLEFLDQLLVARRVSIIRFWICQKGFLNLQHPLFRQFDIAGQGHRDFFPPRLRGNPRSKQTRPFRDIAG
jgi:hypothetical protein